MSSDHDPRAVYGDALAELAARRSVAGRKLGRLGPRAGRAPLEYVRRPALAVVLVGSDHGPVSRDRDAPAEQVAGSSVAGRQSGDLRPRAGRAPLVHVRVARAGPRVDDSRRSRYHPVSRDRYVPAEPVVVIGAASRQFLRLRRKGVGRVRTGRFGDGSRVAGLTVLVAPLVTALVAPLVTALVAPLVAALVAPLVAPLVTALVAPLVASLAGALAGAGTGSEVIHVRGAQFAYGGAVVQRLSDRRPVVRDRNAAAEIVAAAGDLGLRPRAGGTPREHVSLARGLGSHHRRVAVRRDRNAVAEPVVGRPFARRELGLLRPRAGGTSLEYVRRPAVAVLPVRSHYQPAVGGNRRAVAEPVVSRPVARRELGLLRPRA